MHYDKVVQILLQHGMTGIPAKVSDTSHKRAITSIFDVIIIYYDTHTNQYVDDVGTEWKHAVAIMQITPNNIKKLKKERL